MGVREALVRAGIATAVQVDEAMARQQLYGADIVTNLLELVEVEEIALQRALGEAYGMPLAPVGELPYAAAAAIELVPRNVASDQTLYPFRLDDGVLTVISSGPLQERVAVDIGFALKVQLRALFTLAPRIKQAVSRDYAFALDRRSQKALGRLERASNRVVSDQPPPLPEMRTVSQFPRPRSIAPFGFPAGWSDSTTPEAARVVAQTARQPAVRDVDPNDLREPPETSRSIFGQYPSQPEFPGVVERSEPPGSGPHPGRKPAGENSRAPRRRGPYTLSEAKNDLSRTSNGDEVLDVFFDYAAQFFDYAVVFALHGDFVDAREARGRGQTLGLLPERFPLAEHPALRQVVESGTYSLVQLEQADPELARLLLRETGEPSLLLPVAVRGRAVVVLCGGFDTEPVTLDQVGDLLAFCPLVTKAFEHAILARKGQLSTGNVVGFQPRRRRFVAPSAEDRAKVLADLLNNGGGTDPNR
jgi:hypothetical protein